MANTNLEGIDGVRISWNVWPRMKVEASKCVIPLAASISPIRPHPDITTLCFATKPVPLFSTLTLMSSSPPRSRYAFFVTNAAISLLTIPWSPIPISLANSTLNTPSFSTLSSVFVFVLDTCMIEEEMGYVKLALTHAACHWLVAWEHPCWLHFSDMFRVLFSQVRGTMLFPLLVFFFFFFLISFNYENYYKKRELKVRGSLNGKR